MRRGRPRRGLPNKIECERGGMRWEGMRRMIESEYRGQFS